MSTIQQVLRYGEQVWASIAENAHNIDENDEARIVQLATHLQNFYLSLFARRSGIFDKDSIDTNLRAGPKEKNSSRTTRRSPPSLDAGTSMVLKKSAPLRVGGGKGSALKPRKAIVSKRQQRVRRKRGFDLSEISPAPVPEKTRNTGVTSGPPVETALKSLSQGDPAKGHDTSAITADTAPTSQSHDSGNLDDPPVDLGSPPTEPTTAAGVAEYPPLDLQFRDKCVQSGVRRFQLLISKLQDAGEEIDHEECELELFHRDIQRWQRVDHRLEKGLRLLWRDAADFLNSPKDGNEILEYTVKVHNMANGVANSMAHLVGFIVQNCVEKAKCDTQLVIESLEEQLLGLAHDWYTATVRSCGCEECAAVVEFDANYKRCRDTKSEPPPNLEDRPMHCELADPGARAVAARFRGLSASSLQKALYFFLSTPKFSPPTFSTATPTSVQTLTTAYIRPYSQNRHLTATVPDAWICSQMQTVAPDLIPVEKEHFSLVDGDGGEIYVPDNAAPEFKKLRTHGKYLRFRTRYNDAPEIDTAFRFYRDDGNHLTTLGTAHIGIESLRMARKLVHSSNMRIYVQVNRINPTSAGPQRLDSGELDQYGRRLVTIHLSQADNPTSTWHLSRLLASRGYTYSTFRYGIDECLHKEMRHAIDAKRGMFRLPDETRMPCYMPWAIKEAGMLDDRLVQVKNVTGAAQPQNIWLKGVLVPDDADEEVELTPSQETDKFFFKMVASDMKLEAKCFVRPSTIPNAGRGLFLKPHKEIKKGTYICTYAMQPTTVEEMDAAGSSRIYAVNVGKRWFDAEIEQPNCLGRFANQRAVLHTLQSAQELSKKANFTEIRDEDWKTINEEAQNYANVYFDRRKEQLVLKAAVNFPAWEEGAHELYAYYGDIRAYWLPLIETNPDKFPEEMVDIVQWFLESNECNWTAEQKERWFSR